MGQEKERKVEKEGDEGRKENNSSEYKVSWIVNNFHVVSTGWSFTGMGKWAHPGLARIKDYVPNHGKADTESSEGQVNWLGRTSGNNTWVIFTCG